VVTGHQNELAMLSIRLELSHIFSFGFIKRSNKIVKKRADVTEQCTNGVKGARGHQDWRDHR
jgi:hypothetical protein